MKTETLRIEFVAFIPEALSPSVLYVSTPYATASHLCACGCGLKVVTPIRPTGWTLIWDGETVTLEPSIGNWGFPCKSHYWIRRGAVVWADRWSETPIGAPRKAARKERQRLVSWRKRQTSTRSRRGEPPHSV